MHRIALVTSISVQDGAYLNLFACSKILFNHESPRCGENFVTRKTILGWEPSTSMKGLVELMVESDAVALKRLSD